MTHTHTQIPCIDIITDFIQFVSPANGKEAEKSDLDIGWIRIADIHHQPKPNENSTTCTAPLPKRFVNGNTDVMGCGEQLS
jgi:hypothetical protein